MPLPNHIIIRPARQEDVESIVAFSAAMALETEGRRLDQARLREGTLSLLASPERGFFMVAELPQAEHTPLLGQLMITFEWSDWRNAVFWWVQSVYVDPAWRRHGVFRRMHETVMATAKARTNVCGIRLYVDEGNNTAKHVYSRVGMTQSTYQVFECDFILPGRRVGGG